MRTAPLSYPGYILLNVSESCLVEQKQGDSDCCNIDRKVPSSLSVEQTSQQSHPTVYLAVTHPSPRVCVSTADQAAPSTAAAAAAPTAATPSGGVSPQAGSTGGDKAKSGSGSGGDVSEELWIVGRFMENMDTRLGAKQEKIREFLLGCLLAERRKGEDCGCVCGIYVCLRGNVMPVRLRERACSSGPAIAAQ